MGKILTASEVAIRLKTSTDRIYAMAREGLLPSVHMGRLVRFSEPVLEEWIRNGGNKLGERSASVTLDVA